MSSINREITRLESLRKCQIDAGKSKLMLINQLESLGLATDAQNQKKQVIENFYKCSDAHIVHKIKFWKQYQTGEMEANMLTKMNETMTEWIEAGWEYFGQANIKEQSEKAKEEYTMFKVRFEQCKIVHVGDSDDEESDGEFYEAVAAAVATIEASS